MAIHLLPPKLMARVVAVYHDSPLRLPDGRIYTLQACGREREDGMWEGWLEFVADDGNAVRAQIAETTQPTLADLNYWATGITPVYFDGALERTFTPPPVVVEPPVTQPVAEEPAPPKRLMRRFLEDTALVILAAVFAVAMQALIRAQHETIVAKALRALAILRRAIFLP
jgi:hypothetical protein